MRILLFMMTLASACSAQQTAARIQRSATIDLNGTIEKVFPLFGPVREKDWAFGWDPRILAGDGDVEEHMIFETAGNDQEKFTWVINQYRPQENFIEYTVSATERIWFITVKCIPADAGTKATIRYAYTGLTKEAHEKNKAAISKMFESDLRDWESAINYYLHTGKQLQF